MRPRISVSESVRPSVCPLAFQINRRNSNWSVENLCFHVFRTHFIVRPDSFYLLHFPSPSGVDRCPVIAFGGSYGGMLSAYMRFKYPNVVEGAIAASAPMRLADTPSKRTLFWGEVTKDFRNVNSKSPEVVKQVCRPRCASSFYYLVFILFFSFCIFFFFSSYFHFFISFFSSSHPIFLLLPPPPLPPLFFPSSFFSFSSSFLLLHLFFSSCFFFLLLFLFFLFLSSSSFLFLFLL